MRGHFFDHTGRAQFADFIEKYRPAIGQFKTSLSITMISDESTFDMAEEF